MLSNDQEKILIANLKMNLLSPQERERYWKILSGEVNKRRSLLKDEIDLVICPPFVHLESFEKRFSRNRQVFIGAQNACGEKKGAFTGEISVAMLRNININYVIIGHSERRKYFCEDNRIINKKIKAVLKNRMIPIFCIGETQEEREKGKIKQILTQQIREGLHEVSAIKAENIIFAYEPVWAIGSGRIPQSNDILEARLLIKKIVAEKYNLKLAEKIKIVYGGSVVSSNAQETVVQSQMNGALVGGASLNPKEFLKIAEKIIAN